MEADLDSRFVPLVNRALYEQNIDAVTDLIVQRDKQFYFAPAQREALKDDAAAYARSYDAFSRLPVSSKHDLFSERSPFLDDAFWSVPRQLVSAAGTSRDLLAFRARDVQAEIAQFDGMAQLIGSMLKFDARKALLINAYPVGITVPQGYNSIDVGPKPEIVETALRTIGGRFGDVVLICQPHLLRYMASHHMLDPAALRKLRFIIGGTWIPASYFEALATSTFSATYFRSRTLALYGIAEVGLGMGFGTPELAQQRVELDAFYKFDIMGQPFYVDASRYLFEVVDGQVLVTTLASNCATPLLRYATGDEGQLFFDRIAKRPGLVLRSKMPKRPSVATDMQVDTVLHALPVWECLTGNYEIDSAGVVFETFPGVTLDSKTKEALQAQLPKAAQISFTERLVRPRQTWCDLLRKPTPYAVEKL